MSWTKRDFVNQALEELGLASYVFDLQPEQMDSARIKLDAMMASWYANGVDVGYPLPENQDGGDLDQETNVLDAANEAIYKNLAIKLAPSYGKTISNDTRIDAKFAYNALMRKMVRVPEMHLPTNMPIGAGVKSYDYNVFIRPERSNVVTQTKNNVEFINEN